jgi:peroxiredoxin (alkyl hydroperoxide reductase subunit C)
MSITAGNSLPDATLYEYFDQPDGACSIGPNAFQVADLVKGKKIVLFALPGAFTPTCSAKHLPGYVEHMAEFKAKGVDEIFCVSVNDAFVMGAWAREQHAAGKVRLLADGSGLFTKAMGLELDLTAKGLGVRSDRYALIADNGVVTWLGREAPGQFEVSSAGNVLKQLG